MSANTNISPVTSFGETLSRTILAPLRVIDGFFQSIIAANRVANEVEMLSHASDRKLASLGVKRSDIVHYVAQKSDNFRSISG
ncbi:hypothetical protein SAMN04487859_11715 [Roseovarius lutimaris]|uniref:DUF1127 domain-containing protein n=1 Tax=Roseovarius lutimaris TaxID=1005928 RepID=A0A1I5ESN7_9RHOB|nr:hypothetical protein [Roseovarius lutimaris]SFO14477.1 hypothetical protein SAMN04487859_11715 [Roseovarius lutimaris]